MRRVILFENQAFCEKISITKRLGDPLQDQKHHYLNVGTKTLEKVLNRRKINRVCDVRSQKSLIQLNVFFSSSKIASF